MCHETPMRPEPTNRLIALLPDAEQRRLRPHLERVQLPFKHLIYQPDTRMGYAYFPDAGVISHLAVMANGASIELATVGNEGMVGLPILCGVDAAGARYLVQVEGSGLRMKAEVLREESRNDTPFRRLLMLYNVAFITQISQSVACNGLHKITQRCCRWLLMTHDRVNRAPTFPMTHEFLSQMLGVHRPSVTEVLVPLQDAGILTYRRGRITVLDRTRLEAKSCECHRTLLNEFARLLRV